MESDDRLPIFYGLLFGLYRLDIFLKFWSPKKCRNLVFS